MCILVFGSVFDLFLNCASFWIVSVTMSSGLVIFSSVSYTMLLILTSLFNFKYFHLYRLHLGHFDIFLLLSCYVFFFTSFSIRISFVQYSQGPYLLIPLSLSFLNLFLLINFSLVTNNIFMLLGICLVITF